MIAPPDVRLELVNRPESVGTVAAALDGVVVCLGLDALDADGIQTAVAEACKNVVLHAYDGTEGPMQVEVRVQGEIVAVTVADEGIGIRPHLGERGQPHNGLGLPIIHLHAWRVTYTNVAGGGTELRMEFPVSRAGALEDGELAGAVLSRLLEPLEGCDDARAEVLLGAGDAATAEALLAGLSERLGAGFGRVAPERRPPADAGGAETTVLTLAG